MNITNNIRVRFAPSPTGYLHIGGVRTALFNWLFAKHTGGTFILRIEDTDEARSTVESLHTIIDGLSWLGLSWDEGPMIDAHGTMSEQGAYGPYFQMKRLSVYETWVKKLIDLGKAYPCWCTKDVLDAMRSEALARKQTPKYDGRCRILTDAQKKKNYDQKLPFVMRFHVTDDDNVSFTDLIHGDISFTAHMIEDFILLKSSGVPTYNYACVIDDHLMNISHVIRGDDHLSNTPRQLVIYHALGLPLPHFAHLPMILGSDGTRLSKRHGATSLEEYKQSGFLPEAIVNYLSLLGWSTSDSQQLFQPKELVEKFSLEQCSKSAAIFDPQKLTWMNGEYIRSMPHEKFFELSVPFMQKKKLIHEGVSMTYVSRAVQLVQEKVKRLDEIPDHIGFLLSDEFSYDEEALKQWMQPDTVRLLQEIAGVLKTMDDFSPKTIEETIRSFAKDKKIKTPLIFHPLRVAVSGRTYGPSLFEMLSILGKEKVLKRLAAVLQR